MGSAQTIEQEVNRKDPWHAFFSNSDLWGSLSLPG